MAWTHAGLYSNALLSGGSPAANASVQVNVHGGGAATLYTDRTAATGAANPTTTDSRGNLSIYAAPGLYDLVYAGATITVAVAPDAADITNASAITTKADLLVGTAVEATARLGVGADTTVLTADSSQTTGMKWAAASGGGINPPAGDLGGTTSAPTVTGTHLASALPLTQGGTAATSASGARTSLGISAAAAAQSNLTATVAPTTANDNTQSYSAGSVWVNTAASPPIVYVCTSAATSSAVWTPLLPVGTAVNTVAAGNDSRITGAAQIANNLSDVNAASARTNLGLGAAATAGAASPSAEGIVQLAGDLGGTASSPQVTGTHLASPLPSSQGGTGSATQNFVDLTTGQSIGGTKTFTGEVVVPTPANSSDAVTKAYADAIASSLSVKPSAQEATAVALPVNSYSAGVLTASANGALTVDGIAVSGADRVLVQNEAAAANNGIYVVTATGSGSAPYVLTRATDMTTGSQVPGAFVFVEQGTANAGAGFVVASPGPFTIGTTAIVWTQFSGAGEILAGTGLTKTGNTISLISPVAFTNGGTGQTGQQAAMDALAGATTSGDYLRGNGTHVVMASIAAADLPAATSGAQGAVELTGDLGGSAASPQVVGTHLASALPPTQGGTGQTSTSSAYNALAPTTTLGDLAYASGANANTRLPGNTSTAKNFLTQTGNGSVSAPPAWGAIAAGDLPAATTSTQGAVVLGSAVVVPLTATAVQTGAYTAAANQLVPCDATSAAFTVTLPSAPADKTRITIKKIDLSTNAVTIACGGADVFNKSGGPTSGTLTLANQAISAQYISSSAVWMIITDDLPLSQLDARYGTSHTVTLPVAGFTAQGPLTVMTGATRWYADGTYTITSVRASVNTAPVGSSIIVDVFKNGSTIWGTNPSNRPTIAASSNTATGTPDTTSLASGDYLTVNITQVGSTTAGSDLTVQVSATRATT